MMHTEKYKLNVVKLFTCFLVRFS